MTTLSKFDAAEYLDTPEMIAEFLNEAFRDLTTVRTLPRRSASSRAPRV